jgi:nucleotide-binding universal stress UspA family protein
VPYRQILCAIDFYEPSRAALHHAGDLARAFGATLVLVHVYPEPRIGYPGWFPEARFPTQLRELAADKLEEWKREAEGLVGQPVQVVLLEGVPWQRLVSFAREQACDLVVLGAGGATGLAHALIGSVAERLVRHAPCPTLVVR